MPTNAFRQEYGRRAETPNPWPRRVQGSRARLPALAYPLSSTGGNGTVNTGVLANILEFSNSMADTKAELHELFAVPPVIELPPDVSGELQSILRLHSITPQDLRFKWESYTMKMGLEQTKLDLATARAFKKDLQEALERESRGKAHLRSVDKRGAYATPRAGRGDDVFGMLVKCLRNVEY